MTSRVCASKAGAFDRPTFDNDSECSSFEKVLNR